MITTGRLKSMSAPVKLRPVSIAYWLAARKCSLLPPNVSPGVVLRFSYVACALPSWANTLRQITSDTPSMSFW